ncbi:MAG TPA: transcriptional repressor [Syntrophaceticus sp.]|nr:transcriptional repressor [Syntrophaceticus sp.]
MNALLHSFYKKIENQNFRLTPQREAVLKVLFQEKDRHLTSYELYNKAKKICPEIGLATVYRTLELLLKLGLISDVKFDKGLTHYELRDTEDDNHHHLICKKCGRQLEIVGAIPEKLLDLIGSETGFQIIDYSCLFHGYCKQCREKTNTADKPMAELGE